MSPLGSVCGCTVKHVTCPSVTNGGDSVALLMVSGSTVVRKSSSDDADWVDSESVVVEPLDSLDSEDESKSFVSELLLDSFDSMESDSWNTLVNGGRLFPFHGYNWKPNRICQWMEMPYIWFKQNSNNSDSSTK